MVLSYWAVESEWAVGNRNFSYTHARVAHSRTLTLTLTYLP
jgi:hypothetical protein